MNYSNPQKELTVNDWPYGKNRVTAIFSIESGKKGERAVRVTENPPTMRIFLGGGWNKPKKLTFARKMRIVEGDDGKTYIIALSIYGLITVMESNMQYQAESIRQDDDRYQDVLDLFA